MKKLILLILLILLLIAFPVLAADITATATLTGEGGTAAQTCTALYTVCSGGTERNMYSRSPISSQAREDGGGLWVPIVSYTGICNITVELKSTGDITGKTYKLKVFTLNQTTKKRTGITATSTTTVAAASITSSYTTQSFAFTPFGVTAEQYYGIAIEQNVEDTTNYVFIRGLGSCGGGANEMYDIGVWYNASDSTDGDWAQFYDSGLTAVISNMQ